MDSPLSPKQRKKKKKHLMGVKVRGSHYWCTMTFLQREGHIWSCFDVYHCPCCERTGSCLKCLFGIIVISDCPPAEWVIATSLEPDLTAIKLLLLMAQSKIHIMAVFSKRDQKGSTWKFRHLQIWTLAGKDEWCNGTAMQLACRRKSGHS